MVSVLIADAFDVVRRGLREIMKRWPGWEIVAETNDGREVVSLALERQPDLAIVDYYPPTIDGVELTRQIRTHLPATEVLIFTTNSCTLVLRDVLRAGARGIVLKSDSEQLLASAIVAVSRHKPFFSSRISEHILGTLSSGNDEATILTPRETAVVRLIAEGCTGADMAGQLQLSPKTIETFRASALRKLGLSTSADLVRYALRNHLVGS